MYRDRLGQLASLHHHEMLADASRRQLRQQAPPRTPGATSALARRLGAAIAKAGLAAARVPDAIWPARSRSLGETPASR